MGGVVFVFVREDASEAETLAEAFDAAGFAITGNDTAALSVVIWSRHALRSEAFRTAADRALQSGKAIVAGLFAPPARDSVFDAPVIDLSQWDGVDEAALAPLLEAAENIVHPIEADVIVLSSRPMYEDAEFAETPLMITSATSPREQLALRTWEAPIPVAALRPVREDTPVEPRLGAPAPRRDFRRLRARESHAREHAALAFLALAILGGGALVASVVANNASYARPEVAHAEEGGGVSLTSATAEAIGLEDTVPEAPVQAARRGVEPPSARTVHTARYEP